MMILITLVTLTLDITDLFTPTYIVYILYNGKICYTLPRHQNQAHINIRKHDSWIHGSLVSFGDLW